MNANWEKTKSNLSDPKRAFTLENAKTGQTIVRNATGEDIATNYGTFEEFEQHILGLGIRKAKIINKKFNGVNTDNKVCWKNQGDEPYFINFDPAQSDEPTTVNHQQIAALGNPSLSGGLNAATIFRDMHYPLISSENETLKAENKRLQEENRKLETEMLINKTLDGKSTERTNAQAALVKEFAPLASALMEKLVASNAPPALPQGLSGASPVKAKAIQSIMQCDDATVNLLARFTEKIDNDAVWADFEVLLNKHQII